MGEVFLIKISKEKLNELIYHICNDNLKYGLIFKITYVYGRNIGEVLKLKVADIDLKHNALDFNLPTESVSFMIHKSIKEDLLTYIEAKSLKDEEFIFIEDENKMNLYSKSLNEYLHSFINNLNRTTLAWHCPILVNRDFKNLRGQHLFMDGADVKTINQLYRNKNIQSTKDSIDYKELMNLKFSCDSLKKIFYEFTDLDVFVDDNFTSGDLFTVCKGDDNLILEYDYDTHVVNLLGDVDSELYDKVSSLEEGVECSRRAIEKGHVSEQLNKIIKYSLI